MRIALFVTCLVDQLFPQVGLATVEVLRQLGLEVDFDRRQTCCSQPAFNTGFQSEARRVARHLVELYCDQDLPIVVPSGSCAAMIRHSVPRLFESDELWADKARRVAERTWELTDFLVNRLNVESTGARFPHRVTYHDSCHALRELGVDEEPRRLIRAVEGVDFVELPDSDRCCGFGGTFSVKFPEISAAMGREKLRQIRETGAEWVVATDVSCLMHLEALARAEGQPLQTMHVAELLARCEG